MEVTNRQTCFVIMPFSKTSDEHTEEYWTKHFESFLKPAIELTEFFEAHRSQPLRGDILRQIITDLIVSPLVVADLTDKNPNVFWELGVRQSFKHGTITIAEEGTILPFDLGGKSTIFYYPKNYIKNAEFSTLFQAAIRDYISKPSSPDSQVLDTISGRGTFYAVIHKEENIRRVDALIQEMYNDEHLARKFMDWIKEGATVGYYGFLHCSLELLVTHRYLDENVDFYKKAEALYILLLSVNSGISEHGFDSRTAKEFFTESGTKSLAQVIKEFCEGLDEIRKKLEIIR